MLPQISEKSKGTAKKEQRHSNHAGSPASGDPPRNAVQHHQKTKQGENTEHIICDIDPYPQIFQIPYQKLKHKMIFYVFTAEMGILGREIIPQGKGTHHRRVGGIVSIYRKTGVQDPVFNIKHIEHDPGEKSQKKKKKHRFPSREGRKYRFLFPAAHIAEHKNRSRTCHGCEIPVKKRIFPPQTDVGRKSRGVGRPAHSQRAQPERSRQKKPEAGTPRLRYKFSSK